MYLTHHILKANNSKTPQCPDGKQSDFYSGHYRLSEKYCLENSPGGGGGKPIPAHGLTWIICLQWQSHRVLCSMADDEENSTLFCHLKYGNMVAYLSQKNPRTTFTIRSEITYFTWRSLNVKSSLRMLTMCIAFATPKRLEQLTFHLPNSQNKMHTLLKYWDIYFLSCS